MILLQGNTPSHDGCELDVAHNICTGISCEVFFGCFLDNPANTGNKASDRCGIEDRFHELVVRHCMYT